MSREWCAVQNITSRKLERWYWYRKISRAGEDLQFEITKATGVDALAIHELKRGRVPEYHGWDDAKMAKHIAYLRMMMRQGMTEDEYAAWSQREMV